MELTFDWREFTGDDSPVTAKTGDAGRREVRLRALLHQLFESCPVGLFAIDNASGRFTRVNREFSRITGYTAKECTKLSFTRIVAPEDRDRISDYRRRRMQGDPTLPPSYEMLIQARTGERRVVHFVSNVVRFSDTIFGAIQDITDEKLRRDPVLLAQRMDSLAVLAGGLAGEFNNLLGAISGYAELALSRVDAESDAVTALKKIQGASAEALSHVQALLSFARSGANAMESVDLGALVRSVASVLPAAGGRPHSLEFEDMETKAIVRGDASQLEQAIFNVLNNAIESLGESGGRVRVGLSRIKLAPEAVEGLAPGGYVELLVEDSGRGITGELLSRVFQPFFTTKDPQAHPGLGLSTAYGIVREHGGTITMSSEPSVGTTVSLLLPVEKEPAMLVPATLPGKTLPAVHPGADATILIVDDQEYVAELFREILSEAGMKAEFETSAARALDRIRSGEIDPDLLVVDLMMPDMDGRTFVRKLREWSRTVPVVITSGYASPKDGDWELGATTEGFLKKPFRREDVLTMVLNCLHDAAQESGVAAPDDGPASTRDH